MLFNHQPATNDIRLQLNSYFWKYVSEDKSNYLGDNSVTNSIHFGNFLHIFCPVLLPMLLKFMGGVKIEDCDTFLLKVQGL